jgi:hypothetical protein
LSGIDFGEALMNKATIRILLDWLNGASLEAIHARREQFEENLERVSSREAKADLRLGLRLIDEELIARMELDNLPSQGEPR